MVALHIIRSPGDQSLLITYCFSNTNMANFALSEVAEVQILKRTREVFVVLLYFQFWNKACIFTYQIEMKVIDWPIIHAGV